MNPLADLLVGHAGGERGGNVGMLGQEPVDLERCNVGFSESATNS